jgi:ribosomal-protein-alanine N-acetyltransferase
MRESLSMPTLAGQRCVLRELRPTDAASLRECADDSEVARNLFDGFPQPYTQAEADSWCSGNWRIGGYVWGIEVDGRVIGCVGFEPATGWLRCNAEIGYWIGQPHWGRGIAAEALKLATDWAWINLPDLHRLTAGIFSWNEASQAVARKAGYRLEAHLPQSAIKNGKVIDRIVWASYRQAATIKS